MRVLMATNERQEAELKNALFVFVDTIHAFAVTVINFD